MPNILSKQDDTTSELQDDSRYGLPVNILIVDDLPEKLLVYETILEEMGHNLVTANSGEEALRLILKHEFAVILLDVNMPTMNGFETASLIRQRKKSSHTPIIFLTAFSDEPNIAQGYASGAVDYLFTPVVPDILKAKVRVFVELFRMRHQAALQAEERVRRLAAEEADRAKDQFLGMLAHELRNPLGPILNSTQLMRRMVSGNEKLTKLCEMTERQAAHMGRLVDDLLDSTRLAQGKILLRKENCCLATIVRHVVDDYRNIFEMAGVALVLDMDEAPFGMHGDSTRLTQAIGNLLHNAHKFTSEGNKVVVRLHRGAGDRAVLSVEDNGIGIESAMLPFIFDIFRQAEQDLDRNRGGLGLGLSLVQGLVRLHDGTVTVSSAGPGKGATFTMDLPLVAAKAVVKNTASPIANPVPENQNRRILLIEDNPDAAMSLDMLLTYAGYEIETAYSGLDGVKKAQDFMPGVILCDIGLPGIDGYEVVRMMREIDSLRSVYVIALSGYGREQDIRRAREAGFNAHLTKPLDYASLQRLLSGANAKVTEVAAYG